MVFQLLESEPIATHNFKCGAEVDRHLCNGDLVGENNKTFFLRPRVYDVVATESNIFAVLNKDESLKDMDDITKRDLARKVHTRGRKLFICCVYMFVPMKFLDDTINVASFDDDSLPLPAGVQEQYQFDKWSFSCISNYER